MRHQSEIREKQDDGLLTDHLCVCVRVHVENSLRHGMEGTECPARQENNKMPNRYV